MNDAVKLAYVHSATFGGQSERESISRFRIYFALLFMKRYINYGHLAFGSASAKRPCAMRRMHVNKLVSSSRRINRLSAFDCLLRLFRGNHKCGIRSCLDRVTLWQQKSTFGINKHAAHSKLSDGDVREAACAEVHVWRRSWMLVRMDFNLPLEFHHLAGLAFFCWRWVWLTMYDTHTAHTLTSIRPRTPHEAE